jgi:hypothetical protein
LIKKVGDPNPKPCVVIPQVDDWFSFTVVDINRRRCLLDRPLYGFRLNGYVLLIPNYDPWGSLKNLQSLG